MTTPRNQPERELQRAVCAMLDHAGIFYFHCPSERTEAREAKMLQSLGVKPGVADLVFPIGGGCLWIELKTGKGTQSPAQVEFERSVSRLVGHYYFVCRTVEEVLEVLLYRGVPGAERIKLCGREKTSNNAGQKGTR